MSNKFGFITRKRLLILSIIFTILGVVLPYDDDFSMLNTIPGFDGDSDFEILSALFLLIAFTPTILLVSSYLALNKNKLFLSRILIPVAFAPLLFFTYMSIRYNENGLGPAIFVHIPTLIIMIFLTVLSNANQNQNNSETTFNENEVNNEYYLSENKKPLFIGLLIANAVLSFVTCFGAYFKLDTGFVGDISISIWNQNNGGIITLVMLALFISPIIVYLTLVDDISRMLRIIRNILIAGVIISTLILFMEIGLKNSSGFSIDGIVYDLEIDVLITYSISFYAHLLLIAVSVLTIETIRTFKGIVPGQRSNLKEKSNTNPLLAKYEILEKLKQLLDDGVLTQEEFDQEKAKVLNS